MPSRIFSGFYIAFGIWKAWRFCSSLLLVNHVALLIPDIFSSCVDSSL